VPDAIFYNGKVVTVDERFSIQQAFAVTGDRFLAVGTNRAMRSLAGPETRLVDLKGRTVIPGLMDNHNHQYHAGQVMERGVSLEGLKTIREMQDRLREAVNSTAPGTVIYGQMGWLPGELAEKRPPTRVELDQVSIEHPIVVYQARGLAYLNSFAFARLGVTREMKTFGMANLPRDASGELVGTLQGVPYSVLGPTTALSPPTLDQVKTYLLASQTKQLSMGLTSIRDLQLTPQAMRGYYELHREGRLRQRVSMGLELNPDQADKLEPMIAPLGITPGFGDHWLRLDGIAEFNPGSMMREDYSNQPGNKGTANLTAERYTNAARVANRYGWRLSPHVDGDRALDFVLDAFEAADRDRPIRANRWIVEHAVISHPDQMFRLSRLGVLVSAQAQPNDGAAGLVTRYGPRAARALPAKQWLEFGLTVSTGSDWPGPGNNPFHTLAFYVTRQAHGYGPFGVAQRITREQALRLATINNAYMTYEESEKGSIEPGKLADFLVLSAEILRVPEAAIADILPLATYVGGREMFRNPTASF
jgi:predicted amidohydrolase YtcJ